MKFAYWNNGKPKTANVIGSGTKQKLALPNGDTITGKIQAMPEFDLYELEEINIAPNAFQTKGGYEFEKVDNKIIATRTVKDKTLDAIKLDYIKKVKAKRDQVIVAGIEWNGHIVQTDKESQAVVTGAVLRHEKKGSLQSDIQGWRMQDNKLAQLTIEQLGEMAIAIGDHVDACFAKQAMLEYLIGEAFNLETLQSLDFENGWPPHVEGSV